jgi:hypothetical protein
MHSLEVEAACQLQTRHHPRHVTNLLTHLAGALRQLATPERHRRAVRRAAFPSNRRGAAQHRVGGTRRPAAFCWAMRFVLVHSPVVGPSTWRWVADALRSIGHEAIVLNLAAAAVTGDPSVFARAAIEGSRSDEETVIVGHSGAGAVLPLVAAGLASWPRQMIFVDAGMPPCEGTFTAGGDFSGVLRDLATNGMLPAWSQWWGEGVLDALVCKDERRLEIEAEFPRVPLAFFEAPIAVPTGWCASRGAYVLLSEAYRQDANRAAGLGWPVVERPGAHLDIVNDEEAIVDAFIEVLDGR